MTGQRRRLFFFLSNQGENYNNPFGYQTNKGKCGSHKTLRQSKVPLARFSENYSLMCFTLFNENTCKSQLHFLNILETWLSFFAKNCHGLAVGDIYKMSSSGGSGSRRTH